MDGIQHQVLRDAIGNAVQVRIVLDTNMILSDVIYLSTCRHKPEIKTSIQQLIVSQTLIPYAPSIAKHEVEKSLPAIAKKRAMPVEVLQDIWLNYQQSLIFCEVAQDPTELTDPVRDPKDLPFINLAKAIGASGIATKDKDIPAMGGTGIKLDCIIELRDYARAKHVELQIRLGGTLLMVGSIAALIGVIKILIGVVGRLPDWVKIALLGATMFAIFHPKSREFVISQLKTLGASLKSGLEGPFNEALAKYSEAQTHANNHLSKTGGLTAISARTPLKVHVYATCLASKIPLTLIEIERKVFAAGYRTKSKNFKKYLLRVMEQDTRLRRTQDGKWGAVNMAPA